MSKSNETTPNVPTLRFREFTEQWEQKTFDETFSILSNNTLSRAELNYENGNYKNIHYGDVLIKFSAFIDASSPEVPYINDENSSSKLDNILLQDGDIIIADTAEDFTVGKATEIENIDKIKVVSGLHTIPCRPKIKFSPRYLGYYVNSPAYHNQLIPFIQGVKVSSISKTLIKKTFVSFPSLSEQTKIADFLSCLDKKIETQNKIISKYETLIKGLYTQIQSKSAKKEYRICDIVKCHSVGLLSKENLIESGSKKCILYGELFTTYDEVINEIKSRTNVDGYISQGNEILFPSSTTVDAMSLIAPSALNEKGILLGGDMFVLELLPGFNNEYISYYLNLIAKRNLAKYAQGTTITHLYFEHIKNVLLYLPDFSIQISIASKMRKLKTKIQIEKEMLSALQKQKAFLLQSMFI